MRRAGIIAGVLWPCAVLAQEELPPLVVTGERAPSDGVRGAWVAWDAEQLRQRAPLTLDEVFKNEPGFSLYRRQSGLDAHPTSAGVSLRSTGATAAARSLVLLDGVPQNDPFGGWVYWARYDVGTVERAWIAPGTGAAAWGDMSGTGIVGMETRSVLRDGGGARVGVGSRGEANGGFHWSGKNADSTLGVGISGFGLRTDGYVPIDPAQRGAVDRSLDMRAWGGTLSAAWDAGGGLLIEPVISYYAEERGAGTAMSRNDSVALDLSLRVRRDGWEAVLYRQEREFASRFSSVNDDRSAETLALDQYSVPASGTGGSLVWRGELREGLKASAGIDARFVAGKTHERVGTFRSRVAGGKQLHAGAYGAVEWQATDSDALEASARLDLWQNTDGVRVERSLTSGALLRDDAFADEHGVSPSASVVWRHRFSEKWQGWLAAGTSFRLPTLNELYRPYRVKNDLTEANAQLDAERSYTIEAGARWQSGDELSLKAVAFQQWIDGAIGNVPVTDPTQAAQVAGVLPAGVNLSWRQNMDLAVVHGLEVAAAWQPHESLAFSLGGLVQETRVVRPGGQPLLDGMEFPQAPKARLRASCEWQPRDGLTLFTEAEYGSSQYDDVLELRQLPSYWRINAGARWQHGNALYHLAIENLLDKEIRTGLSSDGLWTNAAPLTLRGGVSWEF